MGMKIIGAEATSALIIQDGERAKSHVLRQMRREAKKIMELSKANAPIDEGNLEAAHFIQEIKPGRERTMIYISVGGEVNGVNVDQYAEIMHESVYNLGPKSQAKQAATGRIVGRKYLERALDEREKEMHANMQKAAEDAL